MTEESKSKIDAEVVGHKLTLISPHDIQTCIKKLKFLRGANGRFVYEHSPFVHESSLALNESETTSVNLESAEPSCAFKMWISNMNYDDIVIHGWLHPNADDTTEVIAEVVGTTKIMGLLTLGFLCILEIPFLFLLPVTEVCLLCLNGYIVFFIISAFFSHRAGPNHILERIRHALE